MYSIRINPAVNLSYTQNGLQTADPKLKNTLFQRVMKQNIPNNALVEGGELIHIYTSGAYPDYDPARPNLSGSIFMDDTFNDVLKADLTLQKSVMYATVFDEKKFILIASAAVDWIEQNTPFEVRIETPTEINEETSNVVLTVSHPPRLKIDKVLFYINESAIYADLDEQRKKGKTTTILRYHIGMPFGRNRVRVEVSAGSQAKTEGQTAINNRFNKKPTLHLVAIGINDFPYLGPERRLLNPVRDAQLVKQIFFEKGKHLFQSQLDMRPYALTFEQTTKKSIEMLIEQMRKEVKPNDYFVLFVSSHGLVHKNKYYFSPSDFSLSLDSANLDEKSVINGFGEEQISEYLINIPTIFRMAILDTCQAGKEIEHIKNELRSVSLGTREGISVLAAAKQTQAALDDYNGNGLFTHVMAAGLNGKADYNHDDIVDSMEIAHYVASHVSTLAREKFQHEQDAVTLPDPRHSFSRRFELTYLEPRTSFQFHPNIFTPRESELYVHGMTEQSPVLMNGIIKNNDRHKLPPSQPLSMEELNQSDLITHLEKHGNIDFTLLFETDSSEIPPADIKKLERIATVLTSPAFANKKFLIEGHTDTQGTRDYNIQLSQRRANKVMELLANQLGVDKSRMLALGLGEEYPVANNDSEPGQAKNRRVSIFIYDER